MHSQSISELALDIEQFQALQLAVPLERTKYLFMSMLLSRALNLKDETLILNPASYKVKKHASSTEILPHIAVPGDLWLISDIGIRHLKVKVALLKDINAMLARALDSLENGEYLVLDETLIQSFQDRVAEYRMTDFTSDLIHTQEPEIDHESNVDAGAGMAVSINYLPAELDMMSISSRPSRLGSISKSSNRMSSFSRDLLLGKRKLSIFGLNQHYKSMPLPMEKNGGSIAPDSSPQESPALSTAETSSTDDYATQKASHVNGLSLKSKFYHKLVKRRDLQLITPEPMRSSLGSSIPSLTGKLDDTTHFPRFNVQASSTQRIENQKEKFKFYSQVKRLGENIEALVAGFGRRGSQANLVTLMEFIKNSIFKFIVADICHMIIAKAQMGMSYDILF